MGAEIQSTTMIVAPSPVGKIESMKSEEGRNEICN